jgi:3-deoxy-D-manno-octulosonic-acid transferase
VSAFLARVRPVLLVITETELWPNFFLKSAATGARVAVINARLSSRSMSRYRFIKLLLAHALAKVDAVLAQTAEDAERFRWLGAPGARVKVTGNTKYELSSGAPPLRPALASFAKGCPIFIAGSTAPGEEQIVLAAYRDLAQRFPSLALVVAPRHLDRSDEIRRTLDATGLPYLPASDSNLDSRQDARVLLLDTMGELGALYRRATIAFIGGSLVPGRGGQSLAEPAAAAVPVFFGPYYENHRQLGDALIAAGAGRVVSNASQLVDACANWLSDEAARSAAGQQARSVMEGLAGSTAIIVRHLCELLPA